VPVRVIAAILFLLALVAVVLLGASEAGAQSAAPGTSPGTQVTTPSSSGLAATLEECVTAGIQAERAATFSGEMTAVAGTARMAMRIDVEQRIPGELEYHMVTATGLGVWRSSDAKVKVYKYLKQVTNLSSPASYRGFVRFRWLNAKGHVIKRADRLTGKCLQPPLPNEAETTPPPTTSGGSSTGSGSFSPGA
jgi:hypothetical protein